MIHIQKALIALLIIFYIILLFLTLTPRVSPEYKAYYITKTSNLSPIEQIKIKPLTLGKVINCNNNQVYLDGWTESKADLRWMLNYRAIIYFVMKPDVLAKVQGKIIINIKTLNRQQVSIKLNKALIYENMANMDGPLQIKLDPKLFISGENVIKVGIDKEEQREESHPYFLGIRSITLY